ncbi:CHASE2 domain-containing protein [Halioglobus maricola]|uniref:CHASE2 domain-containing protein n=1 Tax=Halioglobus maricola TaxID=2601894 RepID=A0A5P9NGR3_9GAMM|nr:CHASE2 domain-containing protein [Halioglobus maricola]QFU74735.1 CHASE2 domain-containing protein [Halioglobus maricola]
MRSLLDLFRQIFQYGRGRPIALVILTWTMSVSVISELPLEQGTAELAGNVTGAFTKARQFLFDSYQKNYPRKPLSQPVTIVAIDELSLSKVGQWPWPRTKLAALLDAIGNYQPAAVGLDMYMPEADQTSPQQLAQGLPADTDPAIGEALRQLPDHDAVLAESLYLLPSVLGAAGFDHTSYTTSAGMRTKPLLVTGASPLPHVRKFEAVLASLPELQAAAWGQAILSVDLEFGVVRRIPLVAAIGDTVVPGLPMEMLRVATGEKAIRLDVGKQGINSVAIADLVVPTQPAGDIWLHFSRIEDTVSRYVSAAEVLDGTIDPSMLQGKLVMLGLTGSGLHDMRTTALGELVPGIEIQAQVLESLFDGRMILRPWWMKWLETSLILFLGLLLIWYIPRSESPLARFLRAVPRASAWITLSINLLLIACGYLLFRYQGILFDASSFFIILSSVIGSLIASALIEIGREEEQRAAEQQRVREAASLIAGEFALALDTPIHGSYMHNRNTMRQLTHALASEVARQSGYQQEMASIDIDELARAAEYCDLGLAQVSPATLNSSGSLNTEQREEIATHAELGALAAKAVREGIENRGGGDNDPSLAFLTTLEEVARSHHENWDGSGYPNQLVGENIPLTARIVAIVDTWESLSSDRPWRVRLTREAALEVIRSESGSRFDPELVNCFCKVLAQK